MQHEEQWRPTKFEKTAKGWRPSRDPRELAPSSRLTSGLALKSYERAIETHASGHLLDLGCGNAPLYGIYRPLVSQITCVDWEASPHEISHIDIAADLNRQLPLGSDTYDTILSSSVLEHIWNHALMWQEIGRMLKPGGKIILGTPFLYHMHEVPHDYFRWTRYSLEKALSENGLDKIEMDTYGGPLDVVADTLAKFSASGSPKIATILSFIFGISLKKGPMRRLSDRGAEKMPLGHILVAQKPFSA